LGRRLPTCDGRDEERPAGTSPPHHSRPWSANHAPFRRARQEFTTPGSVRVYVHYCRAPACCPLAIRLVFRLGVRLRRIALPATVARFDLKLFRKAFREHLAAPASH